MRKWKAWTVLAAAMVLFPAASALAQGQGTQEPSLFDAWWARVFCFYLLVPVAAFVRRLFAGWLNFLGIDEEKWAGLGAGMLGGLVGLGMAGASVLTAGSRGAGWLLGTWFGNRGLGWAGQGPFGGGQQMSTGGGTSPTSVSPPGGTAPGTQVGGGTGASVGGGATGTAGQAQGGGSQGADAGGSVLPGDDVPGEGLPEKGSRYEADPEQAKRQALHDWITQFKLYRERLAQDRKWGATAGSVLADAGRAAGTVLGALATIGLGGVGTPWGKELVHAFAEAGAAPGRLWEMYRSTPPPRYPQSMLDGLRWR
ncbi:MAG: hypothetical protein AB1816_06060 [Bacillota bacterium]